eukprot:767049-Hanusia_phi.AAC.4
MRVVSTLGLVLKSVFHRRPGRVRSHESSHRRLRRARISSRQTGSVQDGRRRQAGPVAFDRSFEVKHHVHPVCPRLHLVSSLSLPAIQVTPRKSRACLLTPRSSTPPDSAFVSPGRASARAGEPEGGGGSKRPHSALIQLLSFLDRHLLVSERRSPSPEHSSLVVVPRTVEAGRALDVLYGAHPQRTATLERKGLVRAIRSQMEHTMKAETIQTVKLASVRNH